jgi:hypothetical protein
MKMPRSEKRIGASSITPILRWRLLGLKPPRRAARVCLPYKHPAMLASWLKGYKRAQQLTLNFDPSSVGLTLPNSLPSS